MLNSTQINQIAQEVLVGKEPSIKGPEVDKFVAALKKDIEYANKMGYTIKIPGEWEV